MRPVVFAISGFLPAKGSLDWLADRIPEAEVMVRDIPGFHSPLLKGVTPGAESTADAFAALVPKDRRVIVVGVSTGCLVGLLMRPRELILVEPFFKPMELWALAEILSHFMDERDPTIRELADRYLGFYNGGKDYSSLLSLAPKRTTVLVGEVPLHPRRQMTLLPSLTTEPERQAWLEIGAELHVVPGVGHDVPGRARDAMVEAIRSELSRPWIAS